MTFASTLVMPIYTVETNRIENGSVVVHSGFGCYDHEECRKDEAKGKACRAAAEAKRRSDPIWTARYSHTSTERDYSVTPSVEREETRQYEAICYRHHVGRVVAKGVHYNKQVMSDVWDNVPYVIIVDDNGNYREVETYGGPGWDPHTYHKPEVPADEVDASPEMIAAYVAHVAAVKAAQEKAYREAEARRAAERAEAERKAPRKGRTLRVVRGRKVPIGTQGVCFWIGDSRWGQRVGIKVAGSTDPIWVDARNVEAV